MNLMICGDQDIHERRKEKALPKFALSTARADVSVILVNYNTLHLLERCIGDLRLASHDMHVQVVVVDNASRDGSLPWLEKNLSDALVISNNVNVGFGRANNQALEHCTGRYVLLLNTDAFVAPDALRITTDFLDANPRCGVLGVRLIGRNGGLQASCRFFPTPLNTFLQRMGLGRRFRSIDMVDKPEWDSSALQECDWVPGCYYLVRREVIDRVGLFDPRYFLYYEEVDHCKAVKAAGWKVVYYPHTTVVHIGGESAKSDSAITPTGRQIPVLQIESELLYYRKHHGVGGLWLALFLEHVAATVLGLKRLIKHADVRGTVQPFKHLGIVWRLLRATQWATRPTR